MDAWCAIGGWNVVCSVVRCLFLLWSRRIADRNCGYEAVSLAVCVGNDGRCRVDGFHLVGASQLGENLNASLFAYCFAKQATMKEKINETIAFYKLRLRQNHVTKKGNVQDDYL